MSVQEEVDMAQPSGNEPIPQNSTEPNPVVDSQNGPPLVNPVPNYHNAAFASTASRHGPATMNPVRPVFMPETFTGTGREWSDWLGQFEMAAEVNHWDDDLKLKFMSLLLSGRARDIYNGLSPDSRLSFELLKTAMGGCLEPCDSGDWNRANFLSRRRLLNESAREFGNALRRLIMKAYPTADNITRDHFARDHFIEHVGSGELRVNLRSAKPTSLEGAINLASELEQIRSLEHSLERTRLDTDARVRGVAERSNDKQMEVLLGVVEGLRQEVKTLQSTVQSMKAPDRRPPPVRQGGNAPQTNAPRYYSGGPNRGDVCYECGCNRHFRRDCPYLPQTN